MSGFTIGLSGLEVAQRAIELIGTNIANASTPGYHRQELQVAPLAFATAGSFAIGGAEVKDMLRRLDVLLEAEIVRQQPMFGQVNQELMTLQAVESSLGTVASENLGTVLEDFFNALRELAVQPSSQILQTKAVWAADALASQFNQLGNSLRDLAGNILLEAQSLVNKVNGLAADIAQLNEEIQGILLREGNANLLRDRRDQAIMELSELLDIQVTGQVNNAATVNVIAWGTPLVTGTSATEIEVGLVGPETIGVSVKDANYYVTSVSGGQLGGLIALRNEILAEVESNVSLLARQVITEINQLHCQGLGPRGSFTSLAGWPVSNDLLEDWDAGISAGSFYVRVTDLASGQTTRHEIQVDPTAHTISDIAASLAAVDGLTASVTDSALHIFADPGYEFDFLPGLLPDPASSTLTGTATPSLSGIYQGDQNQTFTCTIIGDGEVGVGGPLSVEVRNGAGELVATLNVGVGYAPGDRLELADGIFLTLSAGTLNDGETFTIQALAQSDTSGLLAAAGLNAFFEGDSALTMGVCSALLSRPDLLATALGAELSDNENIVRMADVGEKPLAALNNVTANEFYRTLTAGVGENIRLRQARRDSLEAILQQLANQWDGVSGVDINEEAAKLLVFERMYQAAAKFVAVQDQAIKFLMDLV